MSDLSATTLKNHLWETLKELKSGGMQPGQADAIAAQAREILRTGNLQLRVAAQAKRSVPADLIQFAEK